MGLLDDAIRQHLELKRAHGADPSDVAEQEREAFGPIKRGDLEVGSAPPEDEEPFAAEEPEQEADEAWVAEPAAEPEPVTTSDTGFGALEEPPPAVVAVEPDPEPAAPEPPAPAPSPSLEDIGEPTQEYAVLDEAAAPPPDAAPEGELDELEETPDFLEETPEHDRLWFEQKPPRDFDF